MKLDLYQPNRQYGRRYGQTRASSALTLCAESCADLSPDRESQSDELLFGHSEIESTARYLGIEVDDAIEIAKKIDI